MLAAGSLVVGCRGVLAPFSHAEDVVDVEVDTQLAVEEIAAYSEVHTFIGHAHAV